jgi:hypothetical protein
MMEDEVEEEERNGQEEMKFEVEILPAKGKEFNMKNLHINLLFLSPHAVLLTPLLSVLRT